MSEATECRSEAGEQLAKLLVEEASGVAPSTPRRGHLGLDEITLVPELFQPRNVSEKHISDLLRAIEGASKMDPVTVFQLPGRVVLIDGHHRHAAYLRAKRSPAGIPVVYFEGNLKEAVLASGEANSKAKLPMASRERLDFAWRLVVIGLYSKTEIRNSSSVSVSQIGVMRQCAAKLGNDAAFCRSWWEAREKARGTEVEMGDDDREAWKQRQADEYAERLAKHFSTKLARHPEIAAMALAAYFGRKLPELMNELQGYLTEEDDDDHAF